MEPKVLGTSDGRTVTFHECLGAGGFGEVYRATLRKPSGLEQQVAVKLLHTRLNVRAGLVGRMRDEGRMLGALNHPSIVRVEDIVTIGGRQGLITEYIEGTDLGDHIGQIPLSAALEACHQVVSALVAALETPAPKTGEPLGLIHRDIKPANIRISRHGHVAKLLDFGIARTDEMTREAATRADGEVGTRRYMAPENYYSEITLGPSADVFSLGATLYESAVGEPLFGVETDEQLIGLAVRGAEPFDRVVAGRLERVENDAVREMLAATLAFSPGERPSTAELGERLEELMDEVEGPRLARWARQADWLPPQRTGLGLEGRTLQIGQADPRAPTANGAAPHAVGKPTLHLDDGATMDWASGPETDAPVETPVPETMPFDFTDESGFDVGLQAPPPPADETTPKPRQSEPRRVRSRTVVGLVSGVAGVGMAVGTGLVLLLGLGGAVAAGWIPLTEAGPETAEVVEPVSAGEPGGNADTPDVAADAPTPSPDPQPAPAPVPVEPVPARPAPPSSQPAPVRPSPAPLQAPAPDKEETAEPRPATIILKAPQPAPSAAPAPTPGSEPEPEPEQITVAPVPTGDLATVSLSDDTDSMVQLRSNSGAVSAAGQHAPGRYEIWAHFGYWNHFDDVVLEKGETVTLRCVSIMQTCAVLR